MHGLAKQENGNYSFASTRQAWHGLGQIVDNPMTTQEAIEKGGLNWEVEKQPLYLNDGTVITNKCATVRTDNNQVLGVVGSKYGVLQNTKAFEFFDTLIEKGHSKIETVGALGKGERIFITSKLPHVVTVGKDDLTEMYAILSSSHDGSGAVTVGLTPVRVVCQNTLSHAISKGLKNKISIRHSGSVEQRVKQAGQIMRHSLEYQTNLEQAYNFLFKAKVSDSVAKELITKIMYQDKTENKNANSLLDRIEEAYNVGVGQENIIGTAWGVFNGITNFLSHEKKYTSDESKFKSLILNGESEKITKRAFDTLVNFANQ